jgi:hypothetical protein
MTTSDRLARLCRLPPPFVVASLPRQHPHHRHLGGQELQQQMPMSSVDCPLQPLWPPSSAAAFAMQGGRATDDVAAGSGAGIGATLQVIIGGMVTKYNPTYGYGGRSEDDSTKDRRAAEHGLIEIPSDRIRLVR